MSLVGLFSLAAGLGGVLVLLPNIGKTDQDIVVEVDRYIVWPGQALAYKLGQLKTRELRSEAERKLGAKFNVRGFHDCSPETRRGAFNLAGIAPQRLDPGATAIEPAFAN